jgi:hypothetical protein
MSHRVENRWIEFLRSTAPGQRLPCLPSGDAGTPLESFLSSRKMNNVAIASAWSAHSSPTNTGFAAASWKESARMVG